MAHPLILFLVKACLLSDPTQCIEPGYATLFSTEEQCRHAAVFFMPQFTIAIEAEHPDFKIKAFACVAISKSQGA